MRVVATHVALPDGHHLLVGRESIRFQSLVELFWYDIAGATVLVLVLGVVAGWLLRRALLSEVQEVSRTAAALAGGDYSRRVPTHGRADALGTLARTVNGMLDQLASQNMWLEDEIAVRRRAEDALHRAHDELEGLVAQRTAQLAQANESLECALREMQGQKAHLDELFDLAPEAIVLTTLRDPANVRINREFTRMFGYTADEAVGRRLRDLIAPPDVQPANLTKNASNATKVVAAAVASMPDARGCKCGSALSHAIITDSNAIPLDTRDKLELLVGKYLGPRAS